MQMLQLRKELERRVSGEERLKSLNLQLRDRLEQYQKQNSENVERATQELTSLQADMQATLEQQVHFYVADLVTSSNTIYFLNLCDWQWDLKVNASPWMAF